MNSRSSHILILWKFKMKSNRLQFLDHQQKSCKSWTDWSPAELRSSNYLTNHVVKNKLKLIATRIIKEGEDHQKWDKNLSPIPEVSINEVPSQKSSLHSCPREVQDEVLRDFVVRGAWHLRPLRSQKMKKPVMSWHWTKWILAPEASEAEVRLVP